MPRPASAGLSRAGQAASSAAQRRSTISRLVRSLSPPILYFAPGPALREREQNARAVVLDVEPVAHVAAVAVDGQRLALHGVQDHERDQLLRELVRAVVVGAVGEQRRQPVRLVIGAHQVVGRRLGRGVGRVGRIGACLREKRPVGPSEPYTSSVETCRKRNAARDAGVEIGGVAARGVEQLEGPDHVGRRRRRAARRSSGPRGSRRRSSRRPSGGGRPAPRRRRRGR